MVSLSTVNQLKNLNTSSMVVPNDAELRQMQLVILSVLDDVVSFCEQNNIRYSLGGGSALGAVRHQGFIPWDDDVDLDMPRADYNRFVALFPQQFAEKYSVRCPELTPQDGLSMLRVRLKGTKARMHEDYNNDDCGVFVDIFPIENTYNSAFRRWLQGMSCMAVGLFHSCRRFYRDKDFYLDFAKENKEFCKSVKLKAAIGMLLSFKSMESWTKTLVRTYSQCKDDNSEYVSVPAGRGHFFDELYRRADFVETRKIAFEGRQLDVPKDAEGYLTHHYGDYMTLPSKQEQEHHAYLELDLGSYASEQGVSEQGANQQDAAEQDAAHD